MKKSQDSRFFSIDLFSGCGGLTQGMSDAGFQTKVAVELEEDAVKAFKLNHPDTQVIQKDIREISVDEIKSVLGDQRLHLLAGCPPCQGFSRVRRLNKAQCVDDDRNNLVEEYYRLVEGLMPYTIMMENVPGLEEYSLFQEIVKNLRNLGYKIEHKVVDVKKYGVPQSRRRLIMVGSLLGQLNIAEGSQKKVTVRKKIEHLPTPDATDDPMQKIVANHSDRIMERIKKTPKDGGSWKDLPEEYILDCHKKKNVGFNDIYGRLRWDDYSTTITGGCLNPSKGRFLHPEQDRVITPREAALLQSFPEDYKFPTDIAKSSLALLIGNALPPEFSRIHSDNIARHLSEHLN
ncbi:DNA cytosine methyltransferase [Halalkalibaculum sp. DA3122]|uniref:DNA cytosine methyltransferase n=1 Tax=Halalkalibaculum sp. DA3122 TaxID=3373607 RepID=UPI0037540243